MATTTAAREVFVRWERRRLPYNALLLLASSGFLLMLKDELLLPGPLEVAARLLVGCLLANLCFTAGPLVETYVRWLGVRRPLVTAALFTLGVLISLPLVFLFELAAFGWTIG